METEDIIDANGALILPNGNLDLSTKLCSYVRLRTDELLARISEVDTSDETLADKESRKAVRERIYELAKTVEDIRNSGKALIVKALEATEVARVIAQMDNRLMTYSTRKDPLSAYVRLADAVAAKKDALDAWEAANKAPEPKHTYCVQVECTDKALKGITTALEKYAANNYRMSAPQSDKAFKALEKWFAENA